MEFATNNLLDKSWGTTVHQYYIMFMRFQDTNKSPFPEFYCSFGCGNSKSSRRYYQLRLSKIVQPPKFYLYICVNADQHEMTSLDTSY